MNEIVVLKSTLPSGAIKRKRQRLDTSLKKPKLSHPQTYNHLQVDQLPWKVVSRSTEAGYNEDGLLLLEEVEGVDIEYEQVGHGRVVKFNLTGGPSKTSNEKVDKSTKSIEEDPEEHFDSSLLPLWAGFSLHPLLLASLHKQSFISPTPIQCRTLPYALNGRDVIGIAETGSGKTLAYGLPILNYILNQPKTSSEKMLSALILTPTRELALQVSEHLNACTTMSQRPRLSIGTVVGGMSAQKQSRIIDRGIDILVATPGRLWDLLHNEDALAYQLKRLRFLVLDEADRMIEATRFAELEDILRLTLRPSTQEGEIEEDVGTLQTFVFSATLSKDLQHNLTKRRKSLPQKGDNTALDELILRLDFRDPSPEIVNLSLQGGVVSTLQESMIECLTGEKDSYLYYFLLRYPGRSLIFVSSIDGIRRLTPLLELLQIKAWPLHSQLAQKQRLKNLDRFRSTPNSALVATDVAARGLDIPAVDHVIHYQVPRSADLYIHRNGRTARAKRRGFGLLICGPDEKRLVGGLMSKFGRSVTELPELPINHNILEKLKQRLRIAHQIDITRHRIRKENHEKNWMKEAAAAMDVEFDDVDDTLPKGPSKAQQTKTAFLMAELRELIAQPVIARGISMKYITSGSRTIVDELVHGGQGTLLGLSGVEASEDVMANSAKAKGKRIARAV